MVTLKINAHIPSKFNVHEYNRNACIFLGSKHSVDLKLLASA